MCVRTVGEEREREKEGEGRDTGERKTESESCSETHTHPCSRATFLFCLHTPSRTRRRPLSFSFPLSSCILSFSVRCSLPSPLLAIDRQTVKRSERARVERERENQKTRSTTTVAQTVMHACARVCACVCGFENRVNVDERWRSESRIQSMRRKGGEWGAEERKDPWCASGRSGCGARKASCAA